MLFRFSGAFLFRFADRALRGLLFQLPPRITRSVACDRPPAEKLLATDDEELVEGNTWNDRFWGVCRGEGRNELGKILMRVRAELREAWLRTDRAEAVTECGGRSVRGA